MPLLLWIAQEQELALVFHADDCAPLLVPPTPEEAARCTNIGTGCRKWDVWGTETAHPFDRCVYKRFPPVVSGLMRLPG
jgi:hypothetical protein